MKVCGHDHTPSSLTLGKRPGSWTLEPLWTGVENIESLSLAMIRKLNLSDLKGSYRHIYKKKIEIKIWHKYQT
jgi:hypothetical protein